MTTIDGAFGYPPIQPDPHQQAQVALDAAGRPTDRVFESVTLEQAGPNLRAEALHHAVLFHGADSSADDVVNTARVFHNFLVEVDA